MGAVDLAPPTSIGGEVPNDVPEAAAQHVPLTPTPSSDGCENDSAVIASSNAGVANPADASQQVGEESQQQLQDDNQQQQSQLTDQESPRAEAAAAAAAAGPPPTSTPSQAITAATATTTSTSPPPPPPPSQTSQPTSPPAAETGAAPADAGGGFAPLTSSVVASMEVPSPSVPESPIPAPTPIPPSSSASAAPGPRRPVQDCCLLDLMARFDAHRLRSEFQTLYVARMHHQHEQQRKAQPLPPEPQVFPPELDSHSRALAKRLMEREKEAAAAAHPMNSHADRMKWRYSQTEAKKKEGKLRAAQEEISSCTFRPKTAPCPRDIKTEITPSGESRATMLYKRGIAERDRVKSRIEEVQKEKQKAEIKDCTFRPNTARSGKSYQNVQRKEEATARGLTSVQMPRGFQEVRQRLRAANEVRGLQRMCQEDRLGRLQPLDPPMSARTDQRNALASSASSNFHPMPRASLRNSITAPTVSSARRHSSASATAVGGISSGRATQGIRTRSTSPPASSGSVVAGRRGGSQPPSQRQVRRIQNSSQPEAHSEQAPQAQLPLPGPKTPTDPVQGGSGPLPETSESQPPAARPLLYVDVNIAPDRPMERLVLLEGQTVGEVTRDFTARHGLNASMGQRLHRMLDQLLSDQRQSQQQEAVHT